MDIDLDFSKTLVAKYSNEAIDLIPSLPGFDKLQEELESLKQQTKYIEQRQKKRSWEKRGRKH